MHILFISHRPPFPPNKGEKIRTYNQIAHLLKAGHKITVCSAIESQQDISDLNQFKTTHNIETHHGRTKGKLNFPQAILTNQALSVANFKSKELQSHVDNTINRAAVDAIICTSSSMAEYVFNSKSINLGGEKDPLLIMDFMDLDSDKWRQYQATKPFPLSLIYRREAKLLSQYESRIHACFDANIFISQQEIDLFLASNENLNKLHTVSNGIDTDFFQPGKRQPNIDAPTFLFTGVMDYFPNSDAVIRFVENTWSDILAKWPNAQFYIAGMNPTPKVKALSNHKGITVTGYVDDIREYFQMSDIFIAPFRIARGVQNKVLQAFACGLPVISTPIGAEGIDCQDGKHLLICETPTDYTKHIATLINNKALRETLSTNALDLVLSSYSWQGRLKTLDNILELRQDQKKSEPA